jgi:hypothetical protein
MVVVGKPELREYKAVLAAADEEASKFSAEITIHCAPLVQPSRGATMGLKDLLARLAGPQSYGDAMGRQAYEGGSALANMVFLSHGAGLSGRPAAIFDSAEEMRAAGFQPRYAGITQIVLGSLSGDEQLLLRGIQTAMVSFAFIVNSNRALQNMQRNNTSKFRNGLGPSLLISMVQSGLYDKMEDAQAQVLSYANAVGSASASAVLNLEKAGAGDLLEHFILKAVTAAPATHPYAFARSGPTGFDVVAIPVVQETLKSIAAATLHYKW